MQATTASSSPSKKNVAARPGGGVGGGKPGAKRNVKSASPLTTLFLFSIGMITLPLTAYCLARHLSDGSTTVGAFAAIVMVQLLLAAFVYKALTEPETGLKED